MNRTRNDVFAWQGFPLALQRIRIGIVRGPDALPGSRYRAHERYYLMHECRQEDVEARSLFDAAFDRDAAAMLDDDAVHQGEAKAGALADRLGGKERLEDAGQRLRIDAAAGIADGEANGRYRRAVGIG
jgi:hypothetical protein